METYSTMTQRRSVSPALRSELNTTSVIDPSVVSRAKEECLAATPLYSLSVTTTTTTMDVDIKSEPDIKPNMVPSPSQSPTLVAGMSSAKPKTSRSSTPPPPRADGTMSKSSTPPLAAPSKSSRKGASPAVQLISDLPVAREEALRSFNEIFDNNYQFKSLGRSREILESMSCDCTYDHGVDSPDSACGPYSDCINRLTQVECLEDDCRCQSFCQNQRFQRKQYADIQIVLTEKKGYGLRAEDSLPKDTFIYEYVGDVVNPVSFKKRMREYAEQGIRHFYFMMLQKDEFIDATKSGGIGRFANHSCNPNCYVAKWTVGDHVRMGIFAKRDIQLHEELTFNYNVDRYGHQAQECFCGEPMCVGYIGGKTQTDIAAMDDLYLDALGITDEVDLMELKGTKKKKGKKIDDPDFMPTMKPITEKEVPKVVQAIRQTTSRKVLSKLLTRLKMTEDQGALRQIMRLRGYSLMTNVLEDYATDMELITLSLQCMATWPLLNRNKIQDSKVNVPVEACSNLENKVVKELACNLLEHWETLPVYSRIPKRPLEAKELAAAVATKTIISRDPLPATRPLLYNSGEHKRRRIIEDDPAVIARLQAEWVADVEHRKQLQEKINAKQGTLKAIIASASESVAAEAAASAAAAAQAKVEAEAAAEKAARRKERAQKKPLTPEEKEANKEKRLQKLVGAVVVKCMSKHSKTFDKESFKKHAKELTQIIADKEKKSSSYREGKLETLSEDKVAKIRKFAKEYIAKVLRKLEKSGKRPHFSSSGSTMLATPSTSTHTPNSHNDGDTPMHDASMTIEEAMSDSDDSDGDNDMADGEMMFSESRDMPPPMYPIPTHETPNDLMDMDAGKSSLDLPSDPRLRPPPVD